MKFLQNLDIKATVYKATLFRSYSNCKVLSENPFVGIVDNVFDESDINHLLRTYGSILASNEHNYIDEHYIDKGISSFYKNINRADRKNYSINGYDSIDQKMREVVSNICKIPQENCERTLLGKYEPKQSLDPHNDAVSFTKDNNLFSFLLTGGQRILTAILYLNDVDHGGETYFQELDIKIKPRKGRLLIFHNVRENANLPDERTMHSSLPLEQGEKYIATYWFRINKIDWDLYSSVAKQSLEERKDHFINLVKNIDYFDQQVQFLK